MRWKDCLPLVHWYNLDMACLCTEHPFSGLWFPKGLCRCLAIDELMRMNVDIISTWRVFRYPHPRLNKRSRWSLKFYWTQNIFVICVLLLYDPSFVIHLTCFSYPYRIVYMYYSGKWKFPLEFSKSQTLIYYVGLQENQQLWEKMKITFAASARNSSQITWTYPRSKVPTMYKILTQKHLKVGPFRFYFQKYLVFSIH